MCCMAQAAESNKSSSQHAHWHHGYHPNRRALQRDLQKSQSFNPFSHELQQMIHEVGNIELCALLDMDTKTKCKVCLSYWDIGIVYCTCGLFLRKGTEENKKFVQYTMDLFSFPNYYLKKGDSTGTVTRRSQGTENITSPTHSRSAKSTTWYPRPMARRLGSPRQVGNRRRRTRKGPKPACVRAPLGYLSGARRGEKDELTSSRGTV